MRTIFAALALIILTLPAVAEMAPRDGWSVTRSSKSYGDLIDAVKTAAKANKMGVVTQAGPTGAARNRGVTIPGNRIIGLFNNLYAVEVLGLSTAAMIEAPIRMYVTENSDGTATLSYKTPSFVFAPYFDEVGQPLRDAATDLDAAFLTIARTASK